MKIAGYEKISLQDYPGHISCIIFTQGCNLKCPFCQNATLIPFENKLLIDETEILEYLKLRKNVINGVVISGGEPTIQHDLKSFIYKIKDLKLDIKLDTNGTNYNLLKELIDEKMLDYVAMDIKNSLKKYSNTSGIAKLNLENIINSINLLKQKKVEYEFRTTIINEYHTIQDIYEILKLIEDSKYFLQNFRMSNDVPNKALTSFSEDKLILWNEILKNHKNVYIRDIKKED